MNQAPEHMEAEALRRWVRADLQSRVAPQDVLGHYADDVDDQGRIVKYFDLRGGGTGVQLVELDGTAGPIRRVE